nr:hypothetical protein BaRGS_027956 [Batillaria attramentaria]
MPVRWTVEFVLWGCWSLEPTEGKEKKNYEKQTGDKGETDSCRYQRWKFERAEERRQCKRHTLDLALSNSTIRIFESYFESAPQLCLQLYVLFKTFPQRSVEDVKPPKTPILSSQYSARVAYYKFFHPNCDRINICLPHQYQEKVARRIWVFRIVCLILGLAPIIRTIEFLMCGCKSWEPTEKEEMKKYIKQIVDKGLADSCDDRSKSRKPTEEKERKKYIKQIVDKGLADSCDHKSMSREPTEEEEMKKYIKQIVDKRLADSCDDRSKSREPTEEEKGKKYKKQIEDKGLAHDYKSWRIKRAETRQQYKQHTLDLGLANSSMKLLESYFESAPQLCLQLYILFKHFSQRSSLGAILVPHVLLVAFWDIKRNLENPEDRTLENSSMNSNGSINWKTVAFAVLLGRNIHSDFTTAEYVSKCRFADHTELENGTIVRTLYKAIGLRLIVTVEGRCSQFDIWKTIKTIGSGLGFLTIAHPPSPKVRGRRHTV